VSDSHVWYREPMVWLLIAIPGAAVIVGAIMLVVAVRSNDGLVDDDYYRRGLEINRSLQRDRVAVEQRVRAHFAYDQATGSVSVRLHGTRDFVAPPAVNISFLHATREGFDRELMARNEGEGLYRVHMPPLATGRWYVRISTDQWRVQSVMSVPGTTELRIGATSP